MKQREEKKRLKFYLIHSFFEFLIDIALTYKPSMWTQCDTLGPICYYRWPSGQPCWSPACWKAVLWHSVASLKGFLASCPCSDYHPNFWQGTDSKTPLATVWTSPRTLPLINLNNLSGPLINNSQARIAQTLPLSRLLNNLNLLRY